jgi:hypothetical protein
MEEMKKEIKERDGEAERDLERGREIESEND